MRVAWLQDMDVFSSGGGAELTDRAHIVEGIRQGHDIEILLPRDAQDLAWADVVVISNAVGWPVDLLSNIAPRYVVFLHDYWALCKWRLFYPMQEKCLDCFQKAKYLPPIARGDAEHLNG